MSEECIVALIPALNEKETIRDVVTDVATYVDGVVVVDDGSTDKTGQIARQEGAVVVKHDENRGYDESIEDGFTKAARIGATVVFTFDADGQHSAADIPAVLAPICEGDSDVVVGIRPSRARFSEYLFSLYAYPRIGVIDPLCGFKAYRMDVYQQVGCFDTHSTTGTELMFRAKKQGYNISQVDIRISARTDEARFGRRLESNLKIIRSIGRLAWFDLTTRSSTK